jgi:hypothetical protein
LLRTWEALRYPSGRSVAVRSVLPGTPESANWLVEISCSPRVPALTLSIASIATMNVERPPRRAVQPKRELVGYVGGEGVPGELLQELHAI